MPPACECVAFITRTVEHGCRLERLQALLGSAGDRQVYVLHTRDALPDPAAVATLWPRERVSLVPQPYVSPSSPWGLFGGKLIGYSKAAFVLWLLHNASHCDRAWQVEDDVFWTGAWSTLFDAHTAINADLVAHTTAAPRPSDNSTWHFAHEHNCFLGRGIGCREAAGGRLNIVMWPLIRLSRALASEISHVLTSRTGKGFHEAIVGPICDRAPWCRTVLLRDELIGRLTAGHSGETKAQQTLEHQAALAASGFAGVSWEYARNRAVRAANGTERPVPERIYHPAKCDADARLGDKARRWAGETQAHAAASPVSGAKRTDGGGCLV